MEIISKIVQLLRCIRFFLQYVLFSPIGSLCLAWVLVSIKILLIINGENYHCVTLKKMSKY